MKRLRIGHQVSGLVAEWVVELTYRKTMKDVVINHFGTHTDSNSGSAWVSEEEFDEIVKWWKSFKKEREVLGK